MWSASIQHDLARPGGLRRRLSIPNPVNFFRLSKAFEQHQAALSIEWNKSPISFTKPNLNLASGRGIAPDARDRASPRVAARVGARYVLHTDIAQFYPSIYTHSIPWVLHTKAVAKSSIGNMALVGNLLDKEFQACQQGQTKGIAIGPDTSLGIAELLLSPLDQRIMAECNVVGGCRFIDDIELTFRTLSDADSALTKLEALLSDLELQPNALKTRIEELPVSLDSNVSTSLRGNLPPDTNAAQSQWIDYFNRAFAVAKEDRTAGVLRYAVAALSGVQPTTWCWSTVQQLLWQCITIDPGCIRHVVDVIAINRLRGGLVPDVDLAAKAIDSVIRTSAVSGHASEVVWSIWTAMYIGFQIKLDAQNAITAMDDALVATAAMFAGTATHVFSQPIDSRLWRSWLQQDCFYQEYWLFAYEAYRRGWFPNEVAASQIAQDPCAAFLNNSGVTFIVDNAVAAYVPQRAQAGGGGGGGGY
ncbi:RNA-directed DNA polymerase [Permianibacter sp. IMCC34836]|uniref:RNA-directed DNA polymerase n=1 Tax=Permianibacter fluminis TaxID=2738515 RepID=UPI00155411D5|nr:RNA-directed DNA polymerase [Permianibacter fluminis]NQD37761.1 RNA-directed DNA polymerase [Permianibacter fluminis]